MSSPITRLAKGYLSKTAVEIRHFKDSGPINRKYIRNHTYSPKYLKELTRICWQLSIALGHLTTATGMFAKLKSLDISPDGRLGGKGYDKSVQDMRLDMYKALEILSSLVDTFDDEIRAPHWNVKEMTDRDRAVLDELMEEVDQIQNDSSDGTLDDEYTYEDPFDEDESDESDEDLSDLTTLTEQDDIHE